MRTKIHTKHQKSAGKEPQKPWAKLQPRPFGTEGESEDATLNAPLNQAQIDRIARAPNLAGMPLYPTSDAGSAALQAKESAEPNLKSPQGTLHRQAEDQKTQEELLQMRAEPAKAEETLQTQLAEKEKKAVQEKAEVGAEAEKDEAVQAQLETEEAETLARQEDAAAAKGDLVETEEDLAIAQTKAK